MSVAEAFWRRTADVERQDDLDRLSRAMSAVALLSDDEAGTGEGWRRLRQLATAARTAREHLATHPVRPGQDETVAGLEALETAAEQAAARYVDDQRRTYRPGEWLALVGRLQGLAGDVP